MSETLGDFVARITGRPGGFIMLRIETADSVDMHAWAHGDIPPDAP